MLPICILQSVQQIGGTKSSNKRKNTFQNVVKNFNNMASAATHEM